MDKKLLKKIIVETAKFLVTVTVVVWIIKSFGWEKIKTSIIHSDFRWLLVGFFVFVLSILLGALQWNIILKNKKINISYFSALKIYYTGIFFNNFMFGMVAGDAFKVARLHVGEKKGKSAFASTFLERLAGLVSLAIFAVFGGVFLFIVNYSENKDMLPVISVLLVFLPLLFSLSILMISTRIQRFLLDIIGKLPEFSGKSIFKTLLEELFLNLHGKEDLFMLIKVALISMTVQSLRIIVNILAAKALGIFSMSVIHYFFVIIPIIALMMIMPMPLGIRETAGGYLFSLAGFKPSESVIMLFLATVVAVSASLLGGFFFMTDKIAKKDG